MMMFAAVWFGLVGYAMVYSGLRTLKDRKGYSIADAMTKCGSAPTIAKPASIDASTLPSTAAVPGLTPVYM